MAEPFLPNCHWGMKRIEQSGVAMPEHMGKRSLQRRNRAKAFGGSF